MSNEADTEAHEEDFALQELLNEADNLIKDLDRKEGLPSTLAEGFSIDSDDEGDYQKGNGIDNDHGNSGASNKRTDIDDHPLSDEWLSSTPKDGIAKQSLKTQDPLSSKSKFISSESGTNRAAAAGNPATIDAFKQQTSRFASNLASMAQRAASQMAAATAPVQVTGVSVASQNNYNQQLHGRVFSKSEQRGSYPGQSTNQTQSNVPHLMELDKDQKIHLIEKHAFRLLKGESVIMFLPNLLHVNDTSGISYVITQSSGSSMWCCAMSYYRLILFSTAEKSLVEMSAPPGWNRLCWLHPPCSKKIIEIPLASIDRVEKTVYQAAGSSYMGLEIYSKDCGRVTRFSTSSYADTGRVYDSLNTYAFPGRRNLGYLFAFESKRQEVMDSVKIDEMTGQQSITISPTAKRFDAMVEYARLLSKTTITQSPWILWASINSSYQLSATYPSVLVGPATLDETNLESQQIIFQCAAFRSEQRLPSMTWCGAGGASIWRASQPKVGLQGNRSAADELFLRHIAESARGANAMAEALPAYTREMLQYLTGDYSKDMVPEQGCALKILDLRPRSAAMANRTGGYGYENTSNYPSATLQFCNITNIHGVRDSYQRLCGVCNSPSTVDVGWNSLIEDTKWLSHIRMILAASWETAYWVHVWRLPVLLHCSHGWDRTSQVAALSQLFLDPYYRTRHGFSVLVEKDFMSFGHPFHLRCSHGEGRNDKSSQSQASNDEGQISPIFLQFLDCVYQLVQQYPECFEFNTMYLLELSFHIYSCRFGNMLCDTEREREVLAGIRQRTNSVWDHLDSNLDFANLAYDKTGGVLLMPLPSLLRNVSLWSERHCYFSPKPTIKTTPPQNN